MKHLLSLAAVALLAWSAQAQTTFNVDMTCAEEFDNVFVTGPWCGWCANDVYNTMADPDGDGVYTVILDETVTGTIEYKYAINGFTGQENLVNDMVEGANCAPITDYNGYANRQTTQGTVNNDSYGTCDGVCNDEAPTNVTFRIDMSDYEGAFDPANVTWNSQANGWCGNCAAMEPEGDNIYSLTVPLTGDTVEYKFAIGAWDDQEDLEPESSCAKTTYDEGAPNGCCYVNRIVVLGGEDAIEMPLVCWNSCSSCAPACPGFPLFEFPVTDAECHYSNGSLTLDNVDDTLTYAVGGEGLVNGMIELAAGQHVLTATAPSGCSADTLVEIGAPSAIDVIATISTGDSGEGDGQASFVVSGGTPFTGSPAYNIVITDAENNLANSDSLAAGEYTITVTDSLDCVATDTFEMTIQIFGCTDPNACNYAPSATDDFGCIVGPGPAAGFMVMDSPCFDGAGSVMLDSLTASDTTNVFMVGDSLLGVEALTLLPGEYSIAGLDSDGCTSDTTFVISAPDTLTVEVTLVEEATGSEAGLASAMAMGGTPEYTYTWTNMTGQAVSPDSLAGGLYTVTVTDANGCTANASLTMTVDGVGEVAVLEGALFPVPVGDELNVRLATPLNADAQVDVRDAQGRLTARTQMRQFDQNLTLDAASWTSGIYTLQLTTKEAIASWKFVK